MTWQDFYLVCLIAGVALAVLSFLLGSFHLSHLPHHAGGQLHAAPRARGPAHAASASTHVGTQSPEISSRR